MMEVFPSDISRLERYHTLVTHFGISQGKTIQERGMTKKANVVINRLFYHRNLNIRKLLRGLEKSKSE